MADEQNKPVGQTQAEEDAASLADTANPVTPQEEAEMEAQNIAVEVEERQLDAAGLPVQLGDALVGKHPQEPHSMEAPYTVHEALAHPEEHEKTVFFGREFPYPIYTVIFGALALLTVIELIVSNIQAEVLRIPVLIALALAKAAMVVMYYMHLRTDSRIFTVVLMIPVGIALVALVYLAFVPPTGYGMVVP